MRGSDCEVTKVGQPNSNMSFGSGEIQQPHAGRTRCVADFALPPVSDLLSSLGRLRRRGWEAPEGNGYEVGNHRPAASRQVILIQDTDQGARDGAREPARGAPGRGEGARRAARQALGAL